MIKNHSIGRSKEILYSLILSEFLVNCLDNKVLSDAGHGKSGLPSVTCDFYVLNSWLGRVFSHNCILLCCTHMENEDRNGRDLYEFVL